MGVNFSQDGCFKSLTYFFESMQVQLKIESNVLYERCQLVGSEANCCFRVNVHVGASI